VTLSFRYRFSAAATLALLMASAAAAQQTSDTPGVQKETFVDKTQRFIKEKRIFERLSPEEGLYPRLGGLPTGSGIAGGVGYRWRLLDNRIFTDVSAVVSTRKYKAVDATARWLKAWRERFELWTDFRYQDLPQEDFFGLGLDSTPDARTSYTLESTDIAMRGVMKINKGVRVGADMGLFNPRIAPGTEREVPSIEARFTDVQAPGLARQPAFFHHSVFVEVDSRDQPGNPRRGSFYRASFGTWDDTSIQQFNFRRFDGSAAHFIPTFGKEQTIALHVGASYVNNATGDRVPFYLLPYIGGADTLRGFREYRFRDENRLFLNVEYRWNAFPYVDVVPFLDAGEVRNRWEEIGLRRLETSYGIGARVNTDSRVFFRFDIGTGGNEGVHAFMKFGPSF
jgi:outer membrane protein assembly factor BamA